MARIAVIGQSGTGKSWGAGAIIERVLDPDHPDNAGQTFDLAVHFDPEDEEKGLCDRDSDYPPLYKTLEVDEALASKLDWMKVIYNHRYVRVVPDMNEEPMAELYGVICGAVFTLCKDVVPELTAFISADEVGQYATQNGTDPRVLRVQSRGRKYGVETCHIMQRPQQVHSELISQSDVRFYLRITDDNDIRKLSSQTQFNANILEAFADREVMVENSSTGDYVRESTNDWTRLRPHYAGDDGILDESLPV